MSSQLEDELFYQIKIAGLPNPEREYRFASPRKFRADFAYPDRMILIEVEGGTWTRGRHTRGVGYQADCEKYNLAALLGFRVLRFTGEMVKSGNALGVIARMIGIDENP